VIVVGEVAGGGGGVREHVRGTQPIFFIMPSLVSQYSSPS
jgi:hypothetical protein